jgi:tRNA/rRNA methyltransferase
MTLREININQHKLVNCLATNEVDPNNLKIKFVLVETSRAGNVGAAARAMKTMGFTQLVLVKPRYADIATQPEAIAFASGALDVLESAQIVDSVDEAFVECNFAAAISARLREFSPPIFTPRVFAKQMATSFKGKIALVFGNERFGLPNEIVQKCNVLINIPANPAYSSLNLAQAVQIIAYECSVAANSASDIHVRPEVSASTDSSTGPIATEPLTMQTPFPSSEARNPLDRRNIGVVGFHGQPADLTQVDLMYGHLEEALMAIDFLDPANPKKLMSRLRRLFSRTCLEVEEINILRGIAKKILQNKKV